MPYVLDTDTCIYWLKGDRAIDHRIREVGLDQIVLTVITECELAYGAFKSQHVEHNLRMLDRLLEKVGSLQTSSKAARVFGETKAHLERHGTPVDDADLLIASLTLAHGGILVTNNERHFAQIPQLEIQNWRQGR